MEGIERINAVSMETELRLRDVQEMFSTLRGYRYPMTAKDSTAEDILLKSWRRLRKLSQRKKRVLVTIKAQFAEEKKGEVRTDEGKQSSRSSDRHI